MMKTILKSTVMLLTLLLQMNSIQSQNLQAPYVPGQLIVKFKDGKTSKTNHLITQLNAKVIKSIAGELVELWQVDNRKANLTIEQLAASYKDHPDIKFIEPNYLYTTSDVQVPDDPDFDQQWALDNTGELEGSKADADIDAPEAWKIQSESPSVVVGIIDTGVDWRHPDLINNIWQNSGEDLHGDGVLIQNENGKWVFDPKDENGKDDDGNGYIDDFIGWNFIDDNNQPFDYDAAEDGDYLQAHGTHVAGIIGASGNNGIGVTGVTHKVQLAILKFLSDDPIPAGEAADAAEAIDYASKMNFQISNNSWGGIQKSNLIKGSIEKAAANNHLFIAAAGNGGEDKIGDDNDLQNFYPANYGFDGLSTYAYTSQTEEGLKNIISVANTDYADTLSTSSNFGINTVQMAAPGINIYSCLPFGYGWLSGTSMATPHVTGACALLWERGTELYDTIHYEMIKDWVINHADSLPALQANTVSGGRLNLHQSLLAIEQPAYQDLYQNCRQRDSLTLSIIYDALNGEQWFPTALNNGTFDFYFDTWDLTQSMDTWRGVRLNSMGCVTHLNLSSYPRYSYDFSTGTYIYTVLPLKGQIPAEVGNLSELVELVLNNNIISNQYDRIYKDSIEIHKTIYRINLTETTGSLPAEIGKLSKLKTLILSGKLFADNIPTELGKLQQLNHLDLSGNNLNGSIPTTLMNLPRLMSLNLSYNNLDGDIPEELYNLGSLQKLDLFANNLTGSIPDSFESLDLKVLDLAYNNFNGNIPPSIGYMPNLYFLLLEHNQLVGSIPPEFYNLRNLYSDSGFNISHNQLSGCYDPYLAYIGSDGDKLINEKNIYGNYQVSDGNNFDADWEDFDEGACWATEVSKVWPGDFNNDGIVNQKDVVFYGFAAGKTGPKREGPDTSNIENINWVGQLCPDWDNQILGINGKHQDADGNGVIDTSDYAVVINNWGLENPDHRSNLNDLTYVSNGIELVLEPVDNFPVGTYDLFLKRAGNADTPVYGVAGEIKFSRPLSPDSKITFDDSCLASDSTYADFKFNLENTLLEFGITQTDNVNIVCEGPLARAIIVMVEAEGEGGDQFLTFKIDGITSEANTQSGGDVNKAIGSSMSQTLQAPSDDNFNIRVSANPQRCRVGGRATAYVSGGIRPYQYLWSTSDTTNKIINLEAGGYTLIVSDNYGLSDTLTVEIEDQQLPEYDENGELISCEMMIETNCANNIDFDQYITDENNRIVEQGFYAARKNIYTSGKILENKEVDLQAGEEVILKPGFTMEQNTELNAIIQNCNEE